MDKGLEAHKRAEHYERKAEGVGRAGISSDDPDALPKLRDQLSLLEATREAKKYLNKYWREHGKLPAAVDAELKTEALSNFQFAPGGTHVPFPPWALSNLGASIRRVKKRIKELEAEAERAPWPGIETEHVTVEESRPDNRMYFRFKAGKPSRDVCKAMRRNGWVWKPSENAWSRQLNNATRFKAEYTAARAGELMDQEAAVEQS